MANVVLRAVVAQHAEEAAFLWHRRDIAVKSPHYSLAELSALDERVAAHLDGLRVADLAGFELALAAIDEDEPGTLFTASTLAVERGNLQAIADILDRGGHSADLSREIVSALGWAAPEALERILPGLLDLECPPPLHAIGIASCAAHRRDPGTVLGAALGHEDARLRFRALKAAGELGRADLLPEVRFRLTDQDARCRFAAAWTAALLGDTGALDVLWETAAGGGRFADRAASVAARRTPPAAATQRLRAFAESEGTRRLAIVSAGALGDAALVPWLIEWMRVPETARVAGESLSLITGVDLRAAKLAQRPPEELVAGPSEGIEDDVDLDPDEHLPYPDVGAVEAWWQKHGARYPKGTRLFLGEPLDAGRLDRALREGAQRQRAAAALEIAMRSRGKPLFEVRSPGFRQEQALGLGG